MADPDFYVGYLPHAPKPLARWLRGWILVLLFGCVALAIALASSQRPIGPGNFEFGVVQSFEGVIYEKPYPMLRLERPGRAGASPHYSLYYLGVFGKHGANDLVAGLDGKRVQLQGALIYRDDQVMIEIAGERPKSLGPGITSETEVLGTISLAGEIVDSKCFLGVMKPGNLKTHKACAIRCISGGVPPVLLVRDGNGLAHYFLLTDKLGGAVNAEVLDWVAEPVRITGEVLRRGNVLILRMNPLEIKALP